MDCLECLGIGCDSIFAGALRQEDHLLGGEAGDKERLPGLPLLTFRLAARGCFAYLLEGGDVREGWVTNDVAVRIQGTPGHHRYGLAFLNQRHDTLQVTGRSLIVDVGLTALKHQTAVTAALDSENRLNFQAQHLPGQKRNKIKTGRTLGAVDKIDASQPFGTAVKFLGQIRRQIGYAAGTGCEDHVPVLVFKPDARVTEKVWELGRSR